MAGCLTPNRHGNRDCTREAGSGAKRFAALNYVNTRLLPMAVWDNCQIAMFCSYLGAADLSPAQLRIDSGATVLSLGTSKQQSRMGGTRSPSAH